MTFDDILYRILEVLVVALGIGALAMIGLLFWIVLR